MPDFKLPDLGEGMTEAEVDRWLVKEGDVVKEDDPIVELITDKATAEIPSPYEGTVTKIHVEPGTVVPVGAVLITISSESSEPAVPPGPSEPAVPAGSSSDPSVPAAGTPNTGDSGSARSVATKSTSTDSLPPGSNGSSSGSAAAVKAMPPVRKLAAELGVDLGSVVGSGASGQITRADVEAHAKGGVAASPGAASGRREAFRGVRRKIAERMAESHRTIPPVTHVEECDVTELDATRKLANDRAPELPRLTFLPFIVKAVVQGLKDHPEMNSSLDEDAGEIVFHDRYNVGVAVDTPAGLVVPVIKDADEKRLRDIASEIDRLAAGARDGTISADELRGGTFTVTSPGPFGGLMATPLILHPQAGILGVHRAIERPVVREGQIVVRKMMNLSITFDHRILDGMGAARFALDVVKLLEHPMVLALEA